MLVTYRPLHCLQQWLGFINSKSIRQAAPWCMQFASRAHDANLSTSKDEDFKPSIEAGPESLKTLPKVALVGRPNVGKSALFNRLVGRRVALVHDTPESHVTRDWREGLGRVGDLQFKVVDTCGVEPHAPANTIQGRGTSITGQMLKSTQIALLVIDAKQGIVGPDEDLARWLSAHVPKQNVVLVANKAEGAKAQQAMDQTVADCYRLGYGDPVAVSATTGEGMADLYVALQPHVDAMTSRLFMQNHMRAQMDRSGDDAGGVEGGSQVKLEEDGFKEVERHPGQTSADGTQDALEAQDKAVRVAIVGLPNVGKSTLLNRVLGKERCVTGPEPGLTRDPVLTSWIHQGRRIELVDTPGYVGQTKVAWYDDMEGEVATKARAAGLGALASSHVVVLVVDAAAAVKSQKVLNSRELALVGQIIEDGKALIVVANKMDAMPGRKETNLYLSTLKQRLDERLQDAGHIEVVEMSAQLGKGLNKLMPTVLHAHACWSARVGTGLLNRWLKEDLHAKFTEGGGITKHVKRIKYITQVKSCPPTYICFVVGGEPMPEHVHSFLAGQLRDSFDMRSTPIRFWFRYRTRAPVGQLKRRRMRLRQPALPARESRLSSTSAGTALARRKRQGSPSRDASDQGGGDESARKRVASPRDYMRQRAEAAARDKSGLLEVPTRTRGKRAASHAT